MPAVFHLVSPNVWTPYLRRTDGPAKVVASYIWTCRERLTEGLFDLPFGSLLANTNLSEAHAREGLAQLHSIGYVSYDWDSEVVLDWRALQDNPLHHGRDRSTGEIRRNNRIPGAIRHLRQVTATPLLNDLYANAAEHSPDFASALVEAYGSELAPAATPPRPVTAAPLAVASSQAPSKPLARASEGGRRGELIRDDQEVSGDAEAPGTCNVGTCHQTASWVGRDGGSLTPYCGDHRHQAFGDVEPLTRRSA